MIGNVWEWTDDIYSAERETIEHSHPDASLKDKIKANDLEEVYVIKGGSYLCAQNYCLRYRPAEDNLKKQGWVQIISVLEQLREFTAKSDFY